MTDINNTAAVANISKITDIGHGLKVLQQFQNEQLGEASEKRNALKAVEIEGRSKLYTRLGKGYEIYLELKKLSEDDQVELLKAHNLEPAKKGFNELRPFTDMMWGEWKQVRANDESQAKWKKFATKQMDGSMYWFKVNRSAEKYAKVLRHAQQNGMTPRQLVNKLTSKSMDQLIEQDTADSASSDKEALNHKKYRDAVLAQPVLKTIGRKECGVPTDYGEKVVALWGTFDANGSVCIMGQYDQSADTIQRYIDKLAKRDGKDLLIAQLEAEQEAAEREQEAASAE